MCFGPGLVAVDGAEHTRQRRMMQPVFGGRAVRRLQGVFAEIAHEVCFSPSFDLSYTYIRIN